jgi:hypothetical protein
VLVLFVKANGGVRGTRLRKREVVAEEKCGEESDEE